MIRPPRRRAHPSGYGYASVQNAYKPSAFFDVEWRWRWARELDDAFPQAVEAEEEFNLLWALDGTCEFHGSVAARALERVGSPDFEDEITPEWAHGTGGLFWRGGDEEDFRLMIGDFGLLI